MKAVLVSDSEYSVKSICTYWVQGEYGEDKKVQNEVLLRKLCMGIKRLKDIRGRRE